jgi:hypothetical protein
MTTSFCKAGEVKVYRQQALILYFGTQGEPRVAKLHHAGDKVLWFDVA